MSEKNDYLISKLVSHWTPAETDMLVQLTTSVTPCVACEAGVWEVEHSDAVLCETECYGFAP